jgi:serine/threonine protein kinase
MSLSSLKIHTENNIFSKLALNSIVQQNYMTDDFGNPCDNPVAKFIGIVDFKSTKEIGYVMRLYKEDAHLYISRNYWRFSWLDRLKFLINISACLIEIHFNHIIHRDLHSGNVLCDDDGTPYIADLGLSDYIGDDTTNRAYGFLPYMSPEVLRKEESTKASDIYSMAMIMHQMTTGKIPFFDKEKDQYLALAICRGLRKFNLKKNVFFFLNRS